MALNESLRQRAIRAGERVAREHGYTALPVDPFAIARAKDIDVLPKTADAGVSGLLLHFGNAFAIGYATHINSEGFQRFSVAHELGHYFLDGHVEALFKDSDIHNSHGNFTSPSRYELEADHFASGLLMPRVLFQRAADGLTPGIQAIQTLAETCKTSLTATAIRHAQTSPHAVAVIMSTGDRIDYCFMSDELACARGISWLTKGEAVPERTATRRFNRISDNVAQARQHEDTVDLREWFGSGPRVEMVEDILGLGTYGKTLTVLYAPDDFPSVEDEEDDSSEWEPGFRKSRRRR